MRLINADKLYPDTFGKGRLAVSQSQIAKAPTVQAVPIDELQYDERVTDRIYRMTQTVLLPEIKVRRMISGDKRNDFLKEVGL